MTVETTTTVAGPYPTNGVATAFPFQFKALSAAEVEVVQALGGIETVVSSSLYRVALADQSGTVIFTSAPDPGADLYVRANPDFKQQIAFSNQSAFLPDSHNEANDRSALRSQVLAEGLARAPQLPLNPATAAGLFPKVQPDGTWGYDPAGPGATGPANSTYTTLTGLKAAAVSNASYIFAPPSGSDGEAAAGTFLYQTAGAPYTADGVNIIKLDAVPLTTGALVRQTARAISYIEAGAAAVPIATEDKLRLAVGVAPEGYGAKGDGVADDTAALQRALSSGRSIQLSQGATYLVSSRLLIAKDGVTLTGGGKIKVAPSWDFASDTDVNGTHLRVLFVTGAFVTIDGVTFDMTGVTPGTAVENGFIWSTAISTKVTDCQFVGCSKGTCVWGLANAPYMAFTGNSVFKCTGAVFVKGRNCVIADNIIVNATDAAIAINGTSCVGTTVTGNSIANEQLATIPSMIAAEEGASRWAIVGNTLTGVNGGGISALNVLDSSQVEGGTIIGNVIDGANFNGTRGITDNPATLISVSDAYLDTVITHNLVRNPPLGNGNTRAVLIPATGTVFADNIVDGSASPNLSALVGIFAGFGGIDIRDNRTNAGTNVRHFLFTPGSYGNAPCSFRGGKFYGGAEGINAELNVATIGALILQIHNIADTNITNIVAAPTILGDRAAYMNAGAWAYPHRIGPRTEMFCTGNPANPGRIPFREGDRFHYLDPVAPGAMTIIRTAGGSPWTKYGGVV